MAALRCIKTWNDLTAVVDPGSRDGVVPVLGTSRNKNWIALQFLDDNAQVALIELNASAIDRTTYTPAFLSYIVNANNFSTYVGSDGIYIYI